MYRNYYQEVETGADKAMVKAVYSSTKHVFQIRFFFCGRGLGRIKLALLSKKRHENTSVVTVSFCFGVTLILMWV